MSEMREDLQTAAPPPPVMRPPEQGGGCGCWLPALLTSFVVFVLVIVGLFLPPVDLWNRLFGTQYAMLSADANAVAEGGLTLVADPAQVQPGFGVALDVIPADNFLAGRVNASWAQAARAAAPAHLALQSPVYHISTTGRAPGSITLDVNIPAQAGSPDLLSLYAWDNERLEWRFVPSSRNSAGQLTTTLQTIPEHLALFQVAPPQQPVVLAAVDVVQTLSGDVASLATIVAPAGLQPTTQGTLTGSLAAGFDLNAGYRVLPAVRNYADPRATDPETVAAIISNRALRGEHVAHLTSFASTGFDGVLIDYRDLPVEQRANFAAFIEELGASLNSVGLLLGVVVPGAENIAGTWETGAYDWQRIGQAANLVQINLPADPTTFTPGENRLVEAMLRWSAGQIDRSKILLGLSARSIRETAGNFAPVGYAEALAGLGDVQIDADITEGGTILPGSEISAGLDGLRAVAGREMPIFTSYIDYRNDADETASRMWLTTGESLRFRMDRTLPFALGGVAFDDLMAGDLSDDVLATILNYKLQLPAMPADRELALRWRIESIDGLVGELLTDLNDRLVLTLEAPDGNYAVNVAVVDGAVEIPRSGAAVALFAPTLTPTPLPTATPTPPPTQTPAPVPVQPAAPSGGPAAVPGAGSINMSGFEYGGHVTTTNSDRAATAMRQAGMNWMKVQIKHGSGMSPDAAAGEIGGARSRGFKVLIAVVGDIGALGSRPDSYIPEFASFLGGVAALGPDAIEVWNEPNLSREWPEGQISGAMYAEMLRQSYNAIKGANGGVMVISGAPAPTGAELAFPGRVKNDDNWIRELINAGGLNYMDCLGAHYNEGVVGPSQRSGDPRGDNYYTRYFFGMLDTYWGLVGGQKPICFTELGYLTAAGYPPLDPFFSWASNVSLEQHAAWLAESISLASQSGRVRLLIVWNVDFTFYGSDPQAGYAMIRADGSCPACQAIAGAR